MIKNTEPKTDNRLERFYKWWTVALSVLIAVIGIVLICFAVTIYKSGDAPYSRDVVGKYLSYVLIPSLISIIGIIVAAVFSVKIGKEEKASSGKLPATRRLKILLHRFDLSATGDAERASILELRKKKKTVLTVTLAASAILIAAAVILAVLVPQHAVAGLNSHVIKAALLSLPSTIIIIGTVYAAMRLFEVIAEREITLVKAAIAAKPEAKRFPEEKTTASTRVLLAVRLIVLALGILFLSLGIFNGGMKDVFAKAVAICTECIGLG